MIYKISFSEQELEEVLLHLRRNYYQAVENYEDAKEDGQGFEGRYLWDIDAIKPLYEKILYQTGYWADNPGHIRLYEPKR